MYNCKAEMARYIETFQDMSLLSVFILLLAGSCLAQPASFAAESFDCKSVHQTGQVTVCQNGIWPAILPANIGERTTTLTVKALTVYSDEFIPIPKLPRLTILNLESITTRNNAADTGGNFPLQNFIQLNREKLASLRLKNTQLQLVSRRDFGGLKVLKTLEFRNCNIATIDREAFYPLATPSYPGVTAYNSRLASLLFIDETKLIEFSWDILVPLSKSLKQLTFTGVSSLTSVTLSTELAAMKMEALTRFHLTDSQMKTLPLAILNTFLFETAAVPFLLDFKKGQNRCGSCDLVELIGWTREKNHCSQAKKVELKVTCLNQLSQHTGAGAADLPSACAANTIPLPCPGTTEPATPVSPSATDSPLTLISADTSISHVLATSYITTAATTTVAPPSDNVSSAGSSTISLMPPTTDLNTTISVTAPTASSSPTFLPSTTTVFPPSIQPATVVPLVPLMPASPGPPSTGLPSSSEIIPSESSKSTPLLSTASQSPTSSTTTIQTTSATSAVSFSTAVTSTPVSPRESSQLSTAASALITSATSTTPTPSLSTTLKPSRFLPFKSTTQSMVSSTTEPVPRSTETASTITLPSTSKTSLHPSTSISSDPLPTVNATLLPTAVITTSETEGSPTATSTILRTTYIQPTDRVTSKEEQTTSQSLNVSNSVHPTINLLLAPSSSFITLHPVWLSCFVFIGIVGSVGSIMTIFEFFIRYYCKQSFLRPLQRKLTAPKTTPV